jgi:hypothetical protein
MEFLAYLKLKYLLFFPARGVFRHAGTDVIVLKIIFNNPIRVLENKTVVVKA